MKTKKKRDIPAWRKVTQKSGIDQITGTIKSVLRQKSRALHIKLHGIDKDSTGYVLFASTTGRNSTCPCCGKTSKTVHNYRFRRIQCCSILKEVAVDLIKGLLGKKGKRVEYPYPSDEEAREMILHDMCEMGDARHRTRDSRLICRCMRSITAKYLPMRKIVRESNKDIKDKPVKVSAKSIWGYIKTGKTDSETLLALGQTHPMVDRIIKICIRFCKMIHGDDDAPDVDTWIEEAEKCKNKKITSFASYIRRDRNAVEQACLTNFSNAKLEGNVNRTKAIKRSMYNRAKPQSLRAKIIFAGRPEALKYHLNW